MVLIDYVLLSFRFIFLVRLNFYGGLKEKIKSANSDCMQFSFLKLF